MAADFNIMFSEVQEGSVMIKNNSTECVIEITVFPTGPEDVVHTTHLWYHNLSDLITALDRIREQ
jgi:hypothetical protein